MYRKSVYDFCESKEKWNEKLGGYKKGMQDEIVYE